MSAARGRLQLLPRLKGDCGAAYKSVTTATPIKRGLLQTPIKRGLKNIRVTTATPIKRGLQIRMLLCYNQVTTATPIKRGLKVDKRTSRTANIRCYNCYPD